MQTPPEIYRIKLDGLRTNADGLYRYEDFVDRFIQEIDAYSDLPRDE